jgi:hypothetical protein
MKLAVAFFAILALAAAPGFPAEPPRGDKEAPPIRMEELEVRGLRERPEILYQPVHSGITGALRPVPGRHGTTRSPRGDFPRRPAGR